jgi:phytol kinase
VQGPSSLRPGSPGCGPSLWPAGQPARLPPLPGLTHLPAHPPNLSSAAPEARLYAVAVPALNAVRLSLVGAAVVPDPGLVKSTSRSGRPEELLQGPLLYVLVLVACTLVFWRESAAAPLAVSMVAGGDGLADIVGRRWGRGNALPWNPSKSWAGTAAMAAGGAAMGAAFVWGFAALGFLPAMPPGRVSTAVAAVALACAIVESLPIGWLVDDNLSVPAVAVALSLALLP